MIEITSLQLRFAFASDIFLTHDKRFSAEDKIRLYGLYMAATAPPEKKPMTGLCACNGAQLYREQKAWADALDETGGDRELARRLFIETAERSARH